MNPKCSACTVVGPCFYQAWGTCPVPGAKTEAAKGRMLEKAQKMASFDGAVHPATFEEMIVIEKCKFRKSDCNCLGKQAVCSWGDDPSVVFCLSAGPGGRPCPGTREHEISEAKKLT